MQTRTGTGTGVPKCRIELSPICTTVHKQLSAKTQIQNLRNVNSSNQILLAVEQPLQQTLEHIPEYVPEHVLSMSWSMS